MYALHLAVYPTGAIRPKVSGHTERTIEHEIDLTFGGTAGPVPEGLRAFVSGSWACWGPADQETEGDDSLHVVFHTPEVTPEAVLIMWDMLRMDCDGRLLDYGVITWVENYSKVTDVVTFRGNPFLDIYSVPNHSSVGRSLGRSDVLEVIDQDVREVDHELDYPEAPASAWDDDPTPEWQHANEEGVATEQH